MRPRIRPHMQRTADTWYWIRYYAVGAFVVFGVVVWPMLVFYWFFW